MTGEQDIHIREVERTGRITLSRPKALNALTYDMAMAIEAALDRWQAEKAVDLIVIDAEGERAFCAGGDLARMYATGKAGDWSYGRKFWADEYRLNAKVANCSIPYVAIMDGIVMGGGVGVSAHGSHRIVTERSMVAMPECGIGLVPDVGGMRLLAHAPGHLGEFLGMSGWRMNGADAIFAGFADIFVSSQDLPALKAALEETADPAAIDAFRRDPGVAPVAGLIDRIDPVFARERAVDSVRCLEADGSEFARKAAKMIRQSCPLSVACTFEMVRRARFLSTIEEVLALEYRFTFRSMSDGDFVEGIRAQIIEKDRSPKWRVSRLEEVADGMVEAMLAPLGREELKL